MRGYNHFAEVRFKLSHWAAFQRDGRGAETDVPTATLFKALTFQVPLGIRSILGLDEWLRTEQAHDVLRCNRESIASDSTLIRALETWDLERLRFTLRTAYMTLKNEGRMKVHLSSGRVFNPCIVDGSGFGGHAASVLVRIGRDLTCAVDAEPFQTGHERSASRRLLDRAVQTHGPGFASHLLYDALFACRKDFSRALYDWKMHLVVKTDDERLEPIAFAKQLFNASRRKRDLEEFSIRIGQGVDKARRVEFEVWSVSGVKWKGLAPRLTVARVSEKHLKGKYADQSFIFWVLTTDPTILPGELRELAHLRWRIENNAFKELNDLVGSKRGYIQNPALKLSLLLAWFWSWTIFQVFRLLEYVQNRLAHVKATKRFLQKLICLGDPSLVFNSS